LVANDLAPGNAGPIMVTDFLTPIAVLVLLVLDRLKPKSAAAELEVARKAMRE
jgi:hypothetical protein